METLDGLDTLGWGQNGLSFVGPESQAHANPQALPLRTTSAHQMPSLALDGTAASCVSASQSYHPGMYGHHRVELWGVISSSSLRDSSVSLTGSVPDATAALQHGVRCATTASRGPLAYTVAEVPISVDCTLSRSQLLATRLLQARTATYHRQQRARGPRSRKVPKTTSYGRTTDGPACRTLTPPLCWGSSRSQAALPRWLRPATGKAAGTKPSSRWPVAA